MHALTIIEYPSGRFGFVGSVPARLAYEASDPEYLRIAQQCGPGFARRAAEREGGTFKEISFASRADARQAAINLGYAPS